MLRLMLADDEQFERDYLEKVVKESYPTLLKIVCKAADGMELLEKMEECDPQIILLDVKMPRMDGLETARRIQEKYPDIPIIIVSAYGDFAYAKQAMKLGVSEYLLKPYLDSELREVLDRVIVRIRDKEDSLELLSGSDVQKEWEADNIQEYSGKDFLWNVVFGREKAAWTKEFQESESMPWCKVAVIFSPVLATMGNFSQSVLDNYFQLDGVTVKSSIWLDQMLICLFAKQKETFSEVNGCIRRVKNYLADEHQIPVACGVSGAYEGGEHLTEAYEEASAFIRDFTEAQTGRKFAETTQNLKKLCELEDELVQSMMQNDQETNMELLTELEEILEAGLEYRDMAVKLNFGRSLRTILHKINQTEEYFVCSSEIRSLFGILEELNFNGDSLRDYMEEFAGITVEKW